MQMKVGKKRGRLKRTMVVDVQDVKVVQRALERAQLAASGAGKRRNTHP
jgi:hypothetical protein